jgi:hypothetical protein
MPILQLIVLLVVLGLVWWLVTTYLPIPQPVKTVISVLAVLLMIAVLLSFAGLIGPLNLR